MSRELAAWIEWLIYRHNAKGHGTHFTFVSPPIKEYNERWFENHRNLPDNWRQVGCDPSKEDLEEGAKNREALYKQREEEKKRLAKERAQAKQQAKPPPTKKKQKRAWWEL